MQWGVQGMIVDRLGNQTLRGDLHCEIMLRSRHSDRNTFLMSEHQNEIWCVRAASASLCRGAMQEIPEAGSFLSYDKLPNNARLKMREGKLLRM